MTSILIIGSGGHCRSVISTVATDNNYDIVGIIDLNFLGKKENILNYPVLGGLELLDKYLEKNNSVFIAVGSNQTRRKVKNLLVKYEINYPTLIHPSSFIDSSATIGNGSFIGAHANVGPLTRIGCFSIVNTHSNIEHESVLGDFTHLAPGSVVCGRSNLGDDVFCGANSTIIERLNVARGSYFAAGTVITRTIKTPGLRYKGIPGAPF
ncbi:acetyltransferase [bacterium]|nr:acetyltransferase [bacterium]